MFPALHLKLERLAVRPARGTRQPGRCSGSSLPLRYVYALVRDFARGDLGMRAMSLVYSTLFAIVPVVAVAFSVLKAFGYHRELEPVLYEFLRPLGKQGFELTAKIMQFVENVQGTLLGTIGFVFLLYTVISMIQKIEEALNFTWHVERPRSLARRVSEYLVVMIVGPCVAVFAMVMLASFEGSAGGGEAVGPRGRAAAARAAHFAPYVLIIALFWFLYTYMPNTRGPARARVRRRAVRRRVVGGGRRALRAHRHLLGQDAAVYAGFAVVLLFLFWLYLSWLILLLGAQLSFYVQHPEHLRTGHGDIPMTGGLRERIAMSAMFLVGERFLDGEPRWSTQRPGRPLDVPATVLGEVISALEAHGLVLTAEDDTLAPARDLGADHARGDPRRDPPRDCPIRGGPNRAPCRRRMPSSAMRADEALRCSDAGPRRCATWCGRRG